VPGPTGESVQLVELNDPELSVEKLTSPVGTPLLEELTSALQLADSATRSVNGWHVSVVVVARVATDRSAAPLLAE
jgi:hypothetical protein